MRERIGESEKEAKRRRKSHKGYRGRVENEVGLGERGKIVDKKVLVR